MRTFRVKLLVLLLTVAFLPTVFLGGYAYITTTRSAEEKSGETVVSSLDQMSKNLGFLFGMYKKYGDLLLSSEDIRNILKNNTFDKTLYDTRTLHLKIDIIMSGIFFQDNTITSAFLLKDGVEVYRSDNQYVDITDLKQSRVYSMAQRVSGKIVVDAIKLNDFEKDISGNYFIFGRMLRNVDSPYPDDVMGSAFFIIPENVIAGIFNTKYAVKGEEVLICNNQGDILSATDKDKIGESIYGTPQFVRAINEDIPGHYIETIGGAKKVVGYIGLPGWDMTIVRSIPMEEFTVDIKYIGRVTFLFSIAIFILIGILSVNLSKRTSKPVTAMVKGMKQLQEGNFEVRISRSFSDEFKVMADQFNMMARNLREMISKLVEEESRRSDAELKMLQYQINPHFLYNTLGAVRISILTRETDQAAELIQVLSRLLEKTIGKAGQMIPVSMELTNLKDFVYIQQTQYGDEIRMIYDIDDEILNYKVPNLLLQPVVENAMFHAFEIFRGEEYIKISGWKEDGDLHFKVQDNGRGMPDEKIQQVMAAESAIMAKYNKIGIANVDTRLKLLFGSGYGISIESIADQGTTVTLKLPAITGEENVNEKGAFS